MISHLVLCGYEPHMGSDSARLVDPVLKLAIARDPYSRTYRFSWHVGHAPVSWKSIPDDYLKQCFEYITRSST